MVVSLIRLKQSGYVPRGDIIVALTDHEEDGGRQRCDLARAATSRPGRCGLWHQSRRWQRQHEGRQAGCAGIPNRRENLHRPRPRGEECRRPRLRADQGQRDLSPHGRPRPARRYDFPINLNETTRTYFARRALQETGQTKADMLAVAKDPSDLVAAARLAAGSPFYNAMLRTTCVATQLAAGHAENALPQTARATLNARVLPNENPDDVKATLQRVLADDQIKITRFQSFPSGPLSPLDPAVFAKVEQLAAARWPGVSVVPYMATGATIRFISACLAFGLRCLRHVRARRRTPRPRQGRAHRREGILRRGRLHVRSHAQADGVSA